MISIVIVPMIMTIIAIASNTVILITTNSCHINTPEHSVLTSSDLAAAGPVSPLATDPPCLHSVGKTRIPREFPVVGGSSSMYGIQRHSHRISANIPNRVCQNTPMGAIIQADASSYVHVHI